MRMSSTGWLATIVLFLANQVVCTANRENTRVIFNNEQFIGDLDPNYAIFSVSAISSHSFSWTTHDASVSEIFLFKEIQGESGNPGSEPVASISARGDSSLNSVSIHTLICDLNARKSKPDVIMYPNNFEGGVPWCSQSEINLVDVPLYFEAVWRSHTRRDMGRSYSRLFTFAHNLSEITNKEKYADPLPYLNERTHSDNTSTANGSPPTTTESPNGLGTPETSTPVGNNFLGNSENKNGGLSGGAIIGIAVACGVIGLLLVFALVWFLRQKYLQKQGRVGSPGTEVKGGLMAEKDGGVDGEAHSPYSDEAAPQVAPAPVLPHHPSLPSDTPVQSFPQHSCSSPYSNHSVPVAVPAVIPVPAPGTLSVGTASSIIAGPTADETRSSVPSTATTAASTPAPAPATTAPAGRALSTPLAHLIEEGMTEEDIRRLEEEERELDRAIDERLGPRARRVE